MKKNNKGFFLAETIVIIALVTTVMAFVYPNVAKLYENYTNKAFYYDQTEDIYTLKAVYDYLLNETNEINENTTDESNNLGCKNFVDEIKLISDINLEIGDLKELYITGYMAKPSVKNDYEFNKYLSRMKKTTYDTTAYRLIGKFKNDNKVRYASIKIENPNPYRSCNLGGGLE